MSQEDAKPQAACRCGWDGRGEHPCHGDAYRCKKPAQRKFYAQPTCLAGAQMKLGATETFACDACWAEFKAALGKTQVYGRVGAGPTFMVRDQETVEVLPESCVVALRALTSRGVFADFGSTAKDIHQNLRPAQVLVNLLLTGHGPAGITFLDPADGWEPEDQEALWVLLNWLGAVRL